MTLMLRGNAFLAACAMAGALLVSACAATTPKAPAASNTCPPGSFAAITAARLPPNARPGKPEMYKDCH